MTHDSPSFPHVRNGTGFEPLPVEERAHGAVDDLCSCPWCSKDGTAQDNPHGVWDTRATDVETGRTWFVHAPEFHADRPRLRGAS
ncbi:MAG TPA: hypothetical protein VIY27_09270 [Myxococcota bacterium]